VIQSSGRTLDGAALAKTTGKTYSGRWDQYIEFCVDHGREPINTGANPKRDLETLLLYVAFEYVLHGNSYETVRGKMYAIRWFVMEHDYPDPLRDCQAKAVEAPERFEEATGGAISQEVLSAKTRRAIDIASSLLRATTRLRSQPTYISRSEPYGQLTVMALWAHGPECTLGYTRHN